MTDTQTARDQKLDVYEEGLTALANMTVLGMPVNVSLRDDSFQQGFALATQTLANLAEALLEAGEAITGPGVDITEEERATALRLLEQYAPDLAE